MARASVLRSCRLAQTRFGLAFRRVREFLCAIDAGWATSVAKIGSVAGPALGGVILSTNLPVRNIFVVLAVCPAVFAACIYAVGRRHRRILGREAGDEAVAHAF